MYSDDVKLTADNVLPVLYLSKKYIVSTLTKRCLQFLEENLTPDTAPVLLEQSMLYEEKELMEKTLTTIQEEAPAVLASDEFMDISKEALSEVLKLELTVPTEVTVFDACMKWAKKQCQQLKKSPSGENIREVLGANLFQIRFPAMSLSDFTEKVAPQNVLTDKDAYQVLMHLTSESHKPEHLPFATEKRAVVDPNPRSLFVPAPYSTKRVRIDDRDVQNKVTSLSCKTTKSMYIKRMFVAASSEHTYLKHQLTVTIKQKGKSLHESTSQPSAITGQLPDHYVVDVDDVRVKAGAMEVYINLKLSGVFYDGGWVRYIFKCSSPETSQLSDNYVTITFPPVEDNLLLGIEYCMA
jgi:hypothetical protein